MLRDAILTKTVETRDLCSNPDSDEHMEIAMDARLNEPPVGYRVSDLASSLGVPKPTIYRWISSGHLPAVSIGKVLVVMRDDLDRFLDRNRLRAALSLDQD